MDFAYNFLISFKRNGTKKSELINFVYESLINSGFKVFLDEFNSVKLIGVDWKEQIKKEIKKTDYFLIFLDNNYWNSDTTKFELDLILTTSKNFLIIFDSNYQEVKELIKKLHSEYVFLKDSIFVFTNNNQNNNQQQEVVYKIKSKYYDHINKVGEQNDKN